jgi:hypothetical protein
MFEALHSRLLVQEMAGFKRNKVGLTIGQHLTVKGFSFVRHCRPSLLGVQGSGTAGGELSLAGYHWGSEQGAPAMPEPGRPTIASSIPLLARCRSHAQNEQLKRAHSKQQNCDCNPIVFEPMPAHCMHDRLSPLSKTTSNLFFGFHEPRSATAPQKSRPGKVPAGTSRKF